MGIIALVSEFMNVEFEDVGSGRWTWVRWEGTFLYMVYAYLFICFIA